MKYIVSDGLRLAYCVDGLESAQTIVMVNSLGTDVRLWDPQVELFSHRARIVRYDCRGHGSSDVPTWSYTMQQLGLDLLALLDALNIERAYLCGLSLGGMIAQWCAAKYPDRVSGLVLANTAARIGSVESWNARIAAVRAGGMGAIREAVLARFLSEAYRRNHPEKVQQFGEMLAATSPLGYMCACAVLRDTDLRGLMSAIHVPSLIIAGELDEATPPAQADELHTGIAGSELVVFPGVAHLSNVEQPEQFSNAILSLLDRT